MDRTDLSSSWYSREVAKDDSDIKRLRAATIAFFRYDAKTPSKLNAWTAFKSVKGRLSGNGYTRGWIPNNAKATNDYKEKASLAYLCNVFMNPLIKGYYQDQGVDVNEDQFALSEMLQWIWRSRIRDGLPITVFIPSKRMRTLLLRWLYGEAAANDNGDNLLSAQLG